MIKEGPEERNKSLAVISVTGRINVKYQQLQIEFNQHSRVTGSFFPPLAFVSVTEKSPHLSALNQKELNSFLRGLFTYKSNTAQSVDLKKIKSQLRGRACCEFSRCICLTLICRGGNMTANVEIPDLLSLRTGFTA